MGSESGRQPVPENPRQYVCPSCRLHLLSWTTHTNQIEMFHKVALWSDFWTGDVRLICQYCLGASEILPTPLVDLLRQRYGFQIPQASPTPPGPRRD
ncbi:MAG TPA: hypothetical protein VIE44_07025 [Methylomirabilota bacterium]